MILSHHHTSMLLEQLPGVSWKEMQMTLIFVIGAFGECTNKYLHPKVHEKVQLLGTEQS